MRRLMLGLVAAAVATVALGGDWVSPGWREHPYGTPEVVRRPWRTALTVHDAPAGVYFEHELDRSKRYRLTVAGSGKATMRLRRDEQNYNYTPAPDGEIDLIIYDTTRLEILIYSDIPAHYEINGIGIEECDSCRIADDVRRLILSEVPGLKLALATNPIEATRLLLDWSANAADIAFGTSVDGIPPPSFLENAAALDVATEYFDYYAEDRAGVYCSGQATFFVKVLRLFDLDGFTVDFGIFNDGLTHVTVVVPVPEEGRTQFYIFDPTFNLMFVDQTNQMRSVGQMIAALKSGGPIDFNVREQGLPRRDFIGIDGGNGIRTWCDLKQRSENGRYVCRLGTASFIESYLEAWRSRLRVNGIPADTTALIRLLVKQIFSVGPSLNPQYREEFLIRMSSLGVPVP